MHYTVYVIENPQGKRYTGSTENIHDRLRMHNDTNPQKARFHKTTYRKGPWVVLFRKCFNMRNEAEKFERYLKTGAGRDFVERARRGG